LLGFFVSIDISVSSKQRLHLNKERKRKEYIKDMMISFHIKIYSSIEIVETKICKCKKYVSIKDYNGRVN